MNTGKVIGTAFPADMTTTTLEGFYASADGGDKKLVYRTDVMRQMPPYPVFPGRSTSRWATSTSFATSCTVC